MAILNRSRGLRRACSRSVVFGFFMVYGSVVAAQSAPLLIDEYQVKAAFVYNFAKFVKWPQSLFPDPNSVFTICVFGHGPIDHWLRETVTGHVVDGRSLAVRQLSLVSEASMCQIVFISGAEQKASLLPLTSMKPGILTIGESDVAARAGAVINLRLEDNQVRFDINAAAAYKEQLQISSKLLSLARNITK